MTGDKTVQAEFRERPLYKLRTEVVGGNGTINPLYKRGEYFREGTVITLTAEPDKGYIVDKWSGTDDDTSWAKTNTITIASDMDITVSFRKPRVVQVPGEFSSISSALNAVDTHGDKIIVSPGTYDIYGQGFEGYNFQGKAITITSEYPDDPTCVASTIIDLHQSGRAFIFENGEGKDSVIDGFTIRNGSAVYNPSTPPQGDSVGTNGENAFGGAIACFNGSSPTLSNLIIENCIAQGQNGQAGTKTEPAPQTDPAAQAQQAEPQANDPTEPEQDATDPNAAVNGTRRRRWNRWCSRTKWCGWY